MPDIVTVNGEKRPSVGLLAARYGLIFPEAKYYADDNRGRLAMDAALQTTPNTLVPVELLAYLSPEVVDILFAPRRARELFTEERQGDWTTPYAKFRTREFTGGTAPYSDFSNTGRSGVNYAWPLRQQYVFQTVIDYGDLETAMSSAAKIDLAADKQASAALAIDIDSNKFQFFGVSGLENYGLLNDPNLPASIVAAASGTASSTYWADKTTVQIYNDILSMFAQISNASNGLITIDTPLTLALSPSMVQHLGTATDFNVSVKDMLGKYFRDLKIVTVPELSTIAAGETVYLCAREVMRKPAAILGVGEKLRAHRIIPELSSFSQKYTAGVYGAVVFYPYAFCTMTGVAE